MSGTWEVLSEWEFLSPIIMMAQNTAYSEVHSGPIQDASENIYKGLRRHLIYKQSDPLGHFPL